ncbi:MAG: hypothetical protein L0215_07350 [Gemmataceae bacterium]|nr:hypothetical protein [Gemmataceae bacterium]
MNPERNDFEYLANQTRSGNLQAKVHLRESLEPQLARIVRRVLERGTAATSLERKILSAARRFGPLNPSSPARTAPVARSLCQMVINRLWPGTTEATHLQTLTL